MARSSAFSNRRTRTMPVVRQRWKQDSLTRNWTVPTNALPPVTVVDGTATPTAIALSVVTSAPTATAIYGTKVYLASTFNPTQLDPTGIHSVAWNLGALTIDGSAFDRTLTPAIGQGTAGSLGATSSATTLHQTRRITTFISALFLSNYTIDAGTWTFAFAASENGTDANCLFGASLYVERAGATLGFIFDAISNLSTEPGLTQAGRVITFPGAAIAVTTTDRLVLEVWVDATQSVAATRIAGLYLGGLVEPTEGSTQTSTNVASYLLSPGGLSIPAETLAIARTAVVPAPTATGGTGATTTPAAIALSVVTPTPDMPPMVVLNTADATDFGTDNTPTVEFTGTDTNANDVRYNVQFATGSRFDDYIDSNPTPLPGAGLVSMIGGGANEGAGQTITGDGRAVSSVSFRLYNSGAAVGNLTAKIYAHTGTFGNGTTGKGTGAALATSGTVSAASLGSTPGAWVAFTFTGVNAITLGNGTHYAITVDASGITVDTVVLRFDNTGGGTHPGNFVRVNPLGTWTADITDTMFLLSATPAVVLDKLSGTDAGFLNTVTGGDTDPFNSGEKVSFTVQAGDALAGGTYYWRARGIDPTGSNNYGPWATARTLTVPVVTTPAAIALTVTVPAPTATGGTGGTATPATIAVTAPVPVVDSYTVSPNAASNVAQFNAGQSFTGDGNVLYTAAVKIDNQSTPAGTYAARIYAHTGTFGTSGVPTGAALATSASISYAAVPVYVPSVTPDWTVFSFTGVDQIVLANGTKYFLVIEGTGTSGTTDIYTLTTSPTHPGNFALNLSPWTAFATRDMIFAVYSPPIMPVPTTTGNANTTPAAIALSAVTSAPTAGGGSNTTPAAIALTVTAPAPTVTGTANTTPAAIALAADTSAPTASGSSNTTPAAIGLKLSRTIDSFDTSVTTGTLNSSGPQWWGQSFTGDGSVLDTASFKLRTLNASAGVMTARIYAHSGVFGTSSTPTGAPLATSDTVSYTAIPATADYVPFRFTGVNAIILAAATNYVAVIEIAGSVGTISITQDSTSGAGHPGNLVFWNGAWNDFSGARDLAFIIATSLVPTPLVTGGTGSSTTPTAIALTAVTPAPTATGGTNPDGTATPTAIALTAVTSAPTTTGTSNATPTAIDLLVVTSAPTTTGASNTTPTAIALTAVTTTPTSTGTANTTPAAIALTAVTTTPTASGSSNTTPAAVALTVVTTTPTGTGQASTAPTAITLTVVTPTPTAGGSSNTTPAAIALTVVVPAPTATGVVSTSPAAIALTTVTPAPTATGDARAPPAAVELAATTPAPTATGQVNASTSPAAITLAATLSAPTASGSSNTTPAAIALATTLGTATATGDGVANPTTIALTVTTATPTVTGTAVVFPTAITLSAVTPAPQVSGASEGQASPAAIMLSVVTTTPTASGGSNTTPAAIALTAVTPAPTATGEVAATPSTIALTATVPAPTAHASSNTTPAAVTLAATVPAPTVTGRASTSPAAISLTGSLTTPTVTGDGTAFPATVALVVTCPQATAIAPLDGTATPTAIELAVSLVTPTGTGEATVTPPTTDITVVCPQPNATGDQIFFPYWGARVG